MGPQHGSGVNSSPSQRNSWLLPKTPGQATPFWDSMRTEAWLLLVSLSKLTCVLGTHMLTHLPGGECSQTVTAKVGNQSERLCAWALGDVPNSNLGSASSLLGNLGQEP